jgi:flagellar basal-body rod protein FlgF
MNSGFYNAAIQMSTRSQTAMEVHTQNLANGSMTGYKRLETTNDSFASVMDKNRGKAEDLYIFTNHDQGVIRVTDRSLDFAIEGKGFFVVSDGEQEFYTRNGSFHMAPDGTVTNSLGMAVQTSSGDLRIPRGNNVDELILDEDLNLRIGKKVFGQLRLASVENPGELDQAGTTLYINNGLDEIEAECSVISGALEQSNTAVFEEMVGIMTTLRNYEACQKMLRSVDEADAKMMEKLV